MSLLSKTTDLSKGLTFSVHILNRGAVVYVTSALGRGAIKLSLSITLERECPPVSHYSRKEYKYRGQMRLLAETGEIIEPELRKLYTKEDREILEGKVKCRLHRKLKFASNNFWISNISEQP